MRKKPRCKSCGKIINDRDYGICYDCKISREFGHELIYHANRPFFEMINLYHMVNYFFEYKITVAGL